MRKIEVVHTYSFTITALKPEYLLKAHDNAQKEINRKLRTDFMKQVAVQKFWHLSLNPYKQKFATESVFHVAVLYFGRDVSKETIFIENIQNLFSACIFT